MTIEELNKEIDEIDEKRLLLSKESETAQIHLTNIKSALSQGMLPNKLYHKYMSAREEYKRDINRVNSESRALKIRRKKLEDEKTILINEIENDKTQEVKNMLEELKGKYFDFYKDKTRIASMRKMASDFIIDIDKILRKINTVS